jgi:transcriptional regulator with XRE-family HTH domain
MMENLNNTWHAMSDPAILKKLGGYIQQTRLQQNKTQQDLSEAAGINRSTLIQMEKGSGGTLLSLIQILRALGQLELFQNFEIREQISPLQLAKMEQKKRKRARRKPGDAKVNTKSEW